MDSDLRMIELMLKRAVLATETRLRDLEATSKRLSRHYSKVRHTRTVLIVLTEALDLVGQDPDHWDDTDVTPPF